jgi:hypothetical protein
MKLSILLGSYTLQFMDMAGDGFCCTWGDGKVVISAGIEEKAVLEAEAPVVVDARQSSNVEVLADSDGEFEYRLSLPFVVATGLYEYTTANDDISLVVTSVVVPLSGILMATTLACLLRGFLVCYRR